MKKNCLFVTIVCIILAAPYTQANTAEDTFTVVLPCTQNDWGWFGADCEDKTIEIPNGRPIYALLVSGFHQNKNLDMFHFYNFAKCLQEKGAYVHYAWWNNLLAPYMEKPLHNDDSVPSHEAIPGHDITGFMYGALFCIGGCYPNKALPAEDYQFQQDATAFLTAIRQHNPNAIIILAGHSMGGDSVVRLADNMPAYFDIDLLAPIDPVGNRTCLPNNEGNGVTTWTATCNGALNFKRFYAVREDWFYLPRHRVLGPNIKYLYHRWQNEFDPPFDYLINEHFTIHQNSTSVQLPVATSLNSGYDGPRSGYPPNVVNSGGWIDGHGEIVGFRGVENLTAESWPLALEAEGNWPGWQPGDPNGGLGAQNRIDHLRMWEKDTNYLYKNGFEPWNPGLCMVSRDLCNILDTITDSGHANSCEGDFDNDGDCDGSDLTVFAEDFGRTDCP